MTKTCEARGGQSAEVRIYTVQDCPARVQFRNLFTKDRSRCGQQALETNEPLGAYFFGRPSHGSESQIAL
jgi:hypothetical protein